MGTSKLSGPTPSYAAPTQSSKTKSNVSGWGIKSIPENITAQSHSPSSSDARSRTVTSSSSPLYQPSHVRLPGEAAVSSPNGRRRRPEGGREETKPTVSLNGGKTTGPASPTTTTSTSHPGQSQQQGGVGPSRRRMPNTKATTRQQRSGGVSRSNC